MTRVGVTTVFGRPIAGANIEQPIQAQQVAREGHLLTAERLFAIAMLFYTADALVPLVTGGFDPLAPSQIKPVDLAIKGVLYAITFFVVVTRWHSFIRAAWNIKWVLVPVLIALGSTAWSQYPSLTLRGSAVLLATTVFGVYFGIRYTIQQQLRLLAETFLLIIIFSYVFAIFAPAYGIDQGANSGDWRGVFLYKNVLAEAMVLACFVFIFARLRVNALRWLGIASSLILLFLSGSATGIIVCLAMIVAVPLYKLTRAPFTLVIGVTLGVLLAISLLALTPNLAEVFQLLNRSPDLTGRTELWNAVLLSIAKRPWLGYGFSAFWQGMNGESESVMKAAGWMPGYAHDGFLDLLLQLGLLGLVTFVMGYLVLWRRALAYLSKVAGPDPVWLCTFLAFILFYNITEGSSILTQNSIYWIVYISTAVNLYSYAPAGRLRPRNNGGPQQLCH